MCYNEYMYSTDDFVITNIWLECYFINTSHGSILLYITFLNLYIEANNLALHRQLYLEIAAVVVGVLKS